MKTVFIYALNDPTRQHLGKTRYVGKAKNPYERYEWHLDFNHREKTHKANWIRSLLRIGQAPILEILDEVPETEWQFWEKEWIRLYRALGFQLTNGTDGGEGLHNPSIDIREKIGRARRGKKLPEAWCRAIRERVFSPETRAKMSDAMRGEKNPMFGKRHSPETRDKQSTAKILAAVTGEKHHRFGQKHSDETRARMRAAKVDRTFSLEHREKIRLAGLGRVWSEEQRAKFSAWARKQKAESSPESRAKMSAAAKRGWARRKAAKCGH